MIKKISFTLIIFCSIYGFSQTKYTVVKGDTAYNIAKKYNLSLDELYALNPKVKDGKLNIGDVVLISKKGNNQSDQNLVNQKLAKITLKPKQTIYGITKQYKISEADLRKLNPNLESHMKIGDQIILPLENIQKYGDHDPTTIAENIPEENTTQTPDSVTDTTTNPKVNEDGSLLYTIQEKDNYYKIGKKFNVTQKDLFASNPGLEEKGLIAGDTIKIIATTPSVTDTKKESETTINEKQTNNPDDYVTYTVQSGDTVFGIINKFGITLNELLNLNPSLASDGLKAGMVLKIKKLDPIYEKKSGDALNVVLMLPFGFDTNDTKFRSLSSDFLAGAQLAIERNAKKGLKMDVKIIDAGNEASFKNSLVQINPNNTDLIIGPFYKSSVLEVLDFVKKDKIPIVAPFANSQDLYDYSNLIIIETNENVFAERIAKEVVDVFSDEKIYILGDPSDNKTTYLLSILSQKLKNPVIEIVKSAAEIKTDTNMMTGQSVPIIAILASDDDKVGDSFGNKMIDLGKSVSGIKAFSMYYSPIFEKKVDDLSTTNLVYLMDRKINTEGDFEKEVLADFKDKYCKTPTKYNVIGFDVVNDMLSRENKKGEILKQMSKSQTQLATKFEFVRVKTNGAFVNQGYRVVRLMP